MKAEINEDKFTELESSEINTSTSLEDEEREHLNTCDKFYPHSKFEKLNFSSKNEELLIIDNKITPLSLNSNCVRIEKMIEKSRKLIKYIYFVLSCLCTTLDGFILIFIGYNTSILNRENKWEGHRLILIDITFHLLSAIGGILSIFTAAKSNMKGLFIGLFFSIFAFFSSFYLVSLKSFTKYLAVVFIICLSNGHIQNICTTQVVKKFTNFYRATVYVFVYFFTQLGKFFFALILYNKNELISKGNITHTVYPILIIIFLQIVTCLFILFIMRRKKNFKESYLRNQSRRESIFNTINKIVSFNNIIWEVSGIRKYTTSKINSFSLSKLFNKNFNDLFETNRLEHTLNLLFLNLSLGIQFFSMINVFPLINGKNTVVVVDEIFWSKTFHTVFLLFIPVIFLFRLNSRKFLLFMTFAMSLFLNVLIFLDIFNSTVIIHLFRFIWNVCYITVNLYCAEAATKQARAVNTAFMYVIFKLSCIIEIMTIDRLIAVSLYVPIVLNIVILIGDMMLVCKLKVETHMKTIEEIEMELNDFRVNKNYSDNSYHMSSASSVPNEGGMFNVY